LRKAVRIVNETLAELQVEQHPDKTFVGRVERGFTFLGYEFGQRDKTENETAGLTGVAPPTIERFAKRVHQLYEQGALSCLDDYVRRWLIWVRSGLPLHATGLFLQANKQVRMLFESDCPSLSNNDESVFSSWLGRLPQTRPAMTADGSGTDAMAKGACGSKTSSEPP
jgi:hypothetical protein